MTVQVELDEEVEFATSGHSGASVRWLRTRAQLEMEVEVVTEALGNPIEQVVNFAPPVHLFGHLYGYILPELRAITSIDLWHDPLARPSLDPSKRTLFVCLPSSWMVLRSMVEEIAALPGAVALHGTGPTTATTVRVVADLHRRSQGRVRAMEIFGATETGAVALREIAHTSAAHPWTLLPDVDLFEKCGNEQLLKVRSPRIARRDDMAVSPEWWQLNDVVRIVGDRDFEFVGRTSRLIKVNGVQCDLAWVEDAVREGMPGVDVVCIAVRDSVRGEHYELFYTDPTGTVSTENVWLRLKGLPIPRAVHRVDQIPRTITGKAKVDRLYAATSLVPPE
ncbi:hypothetical protein [Nocardia sp. NPDC052566]|uniref:hypothetical protein n=1 Tax=Nocardia sp. NPDC052566 TaxID=3364330 RepID=UPI0037C5B634